MDKKKTFRRIFTTKEGWTGEKEVTDPPPVELNETVIEDIPEKPPGPGPSPILRQCTGTFKRTEIRGKTAYYKQV